jgi:hypothetical protein
VILRWPLAFALLALARTAVPADLRTISVEFENERYHLRSEAWFAADMDSMYRVLTDYDLFVKFTSAFVEARNVPPDNEGRPRFFTRMEGCVLLFCKSLVRSGHLELTPYTEIIAVAEPAKSDFKFSRERWQLVKDGEGTLLIYDFEMEPAFWVPPVIGPYVIKRTLASGGVDAIDRIEALAQGRTPKPVGDGS